MCKDFFLKVEVGKLLRQITKEKDSSKEDFYVNTNKKYKNKKMNKKKKPFLNYCLASRILIIIIKKESSLFDIYL